MSDIVKTSVTLVQPAKIGDVIRQIGWSGLVDEDIADQLAEAKAIDRVAGDEPVLVEPATDPRDDLIARMQDDIIELRAQLEVASGSASLSVKLIEERDKAVALVADLEGRVVATEGERDDARKRVVELEGQIAAKADPVTTAAPTKAAKAT